MMSKRQQRQRRSFTPEFRAEVVALCQRGDRSIVEICRDLDLTETSVRGWVKAADPTTATPARDLLTDDERAELVRLRRENRQLREDTEILKRATAFFAKETR